MRQGTGWKIAILVAICLITSVNTAWSQEANEPNNNLTGEVQLRYGWIGVNKDRGRFREDNWITDRSTGGIEWLHLENVQPAENEYKAILEGRALNDYDYDMSLLLEKENSHYFKFDFDSKRRYFDGSNEYWDEGVKHMLERHDGNFFVDRRNYNIELGLTPLEGPQWVFGWHRLEKDGKEVLLSGSQRKSGSVKSIPNVANLRGITDTFYGEVAHTFAEKYNFRLRQEFEQYHGKQNAGLTAYINDSWGFDTASDNRYTKDDFGYTNLRTMLMLDSFLDEQTYATANYMYNYLNNDSTREFIRAGSTSAWNETSVGNSKRTNVGGLGYRKTAFLQVPGLTLGTGVRIEDSKTNAQSRLYKNGFYQLHSSLDEVGVAESIRLIYKGIERTTLSFDADLEQRDLGKNGISTYSAADFDRTTDTDFLDQIYTFKAVHRFNREIKSTVKFRIKDIERSYTDLFDADPTDYPSYLGNYRRTGQDLTVKTDVRINSQTSTTLMYQLVHEAIDFELGGKTSNQEIHRGMGSLSFSPTSNLFLVGTFMLENNNLDTPAAGNSELPGERPYDFRGNSYSLMLDGTYAFNEKTSYTLGFRHTEAMGTVDYAGDYMFDKVGITLKHQVAANQAVGLGYEFYNFNNHDGSDFDDYTAHGVFAAYSFSF